MKTAVIYSGQARSFHQVAWNHHWHLLRKLENPKIYVSVADDAQADDMLALRDMGYQVEFEKVTQPGVPEPVVRPGMLGMYPTSSPAQAILRQFWALKRAWDWASNLGAWSAEQVVRVRPDLAFGRVELPMVIDRWECYTPWWSRWGGVNDRFAAMGKSIAGSYFNAFEDVYRFVDRGCPLHPETILAASIAKAGISRPTLRAEFVTLRMDGTVVPMDPSIVDIADRRIG
jgi:hypothetical protein